MYTETYIFQGRSFLLNFSGCRRSAIRTHVTLTTVSVRCTSVHGPTVQRYGRASTVLIFSVTGYVTGPVWVKSVCMMALTVKPSCRNVTRSTMHTVRITTLMDTATRAVIQKNVAGMVSTVSRNHKFLLTEHLSSSSSSNHRSSWTSLSSSYVTSATSSAQFFASRKMLTGMTWFTRGPMIRVTWIGSGGRWMCLSGRREPPLVTSMGEYCPSTVFDMVEIAKRFNTYLTTFRSYKSFFARCGLVSRSSVNLC